MESEITRRSPKRLILNINTLMHTEIKLRSTNRNVSITKWVTRAILEQIKKEKSYE